MNAPFPPMISVIVCSIDALKFAQVETAYSRLLADTPHEIIVIHDARSLAEGYHRAMARARGDILVFSHDDILILDPDFAPKIRARLERYDLLGFAGTDKLISSTWFAARQPHMFGAVAHPEGKNLELSVFGVPDSPVADGIQALDGLCLIARRETAEAIGFDAVTFDGFHLYDLDFSFSAWQAGKKLGVCCDIPIVHASAGNYDAHYRIYAERFIRKHFRLLGETPEESICRRAEGRAAIFPDHRALLAAWQPEILQRATLSLRRKLHAAETL